MTLNHKILSTSKTYQQSLADAVLRRGLPCLKGVVIYLPKLQTAEDLQGDALLHYDAEMEIMNLILLSIPNDIYNSVDACTSAKDMWKIFVAKPREALVSVYNRFAQLMNDSERNDMHFLIVTINTKFLNSLQPEWLKYVIQVRLAKRLTVDMFDDLFYYLHQFEKLVNVSRAKKLEKSHDPLVFVAHTGSSSRNTLSYYVTHPTFVVDYEDEYQQDDVHTNSEDPLASAMLLLARAITQKFSTPTNNRLRTSSNTRNQAIIQAQSQTLSVPEQQYQLYISMKNDPQLQQQDIAIWLALQMKFESLRVNENEQGPSTSGNQEQKDDYDFWTESYASDDDEIPTKQMSQDIMEEVSLTIDEAKLKKMVDEMLRQRCTSGDEHQYHIDQMKNFLKSDIVWESRKEILVSPHPRKTTPLVQSCQRDPEAPPLSLINQDLLYLKKGSSGPEKIVLSLHKFPAIIFNDDDIEERTSRWVNKCVKKFNPYARYGVEHWKNPHAKIFYIKKQKEPGKPKEEVYSNSKIIQVIKTYWELGHEHKFITEIVARRANECIVSITEPDYKNLNKNDIEDMYLLIMNGKVPDYAETGLLWSLSVFIRSSVIWERVHDFQLGIESYQQKVNLTAPTISFPGVEKHKMFSIIYEPVHGIIYKNSKKEKRVMRHSEIHKFCDATLIRVLEGLKSYNNDVKYGYVQRELTNDEVEYIKLFEEEIEVRLKYRNQMRR
ncbi:hypothetical protein Tco_0411225 [Tanacetum coccineum]